MVFFRRTSLLSRAFNVTNGMGWVIFCTMILFPGVAFSQFPEQKTDLTELSLEELMEVRIEPVYGASKYEQKTMDAPSSVSIITAEDIQKYGYRTLSEILQSVRGFYISYDRNYHYVGIRGFGRPGDYSSRVLLLLDGVKLNDNIFDGAPIGTDFEMDLDLIKRIEVVRGPSYALYGNNAFLVVINVISKSGGDIDGTEVGADIGSFGTYTTRLSFGKQFKQNGQMLISGSLFNSDGQSHYYPEFDTPDQNNGISENNDQDRSGSFFAKYQAQGLALEAAYVKRGKEIPTAPWGLVFNDPRSESWDEKVFLDLKLERHLTRGVDLVSSVTLGGYNYWGDYAYPGEEAGETILNKDDVMGRWWGADLHFTKRFGKHMMIAGGEYHDNFTQDQKNFDVLGDVYLDDNRNSSNWGVFIQDEYALIKDLTLSAGMRYDHFSTFGGTVNPRFAAIYKPLAGTSLKYLFGRAFRAPSVYELYYNDGDISQKASPDLNEETIVSHEVVWEQLIGKYYTGTASLYHFSVKDLISQTTDADDLLVFENRDEVKASGMEVGMSAAFPNGWSGWMSYALQGSDYMNSDQVWSNSPRQLAKFNVSIPMSREGLFLSIEEQYTGQFNTLSGSSAGKFLLTNMTLSGKNIFPNLDLSASVYNLFDRDYGTPGSDEHEQDLIEQDGISFRAKATYRF
jgi:outer membrane receptor for ferrienterochelin and colicins